MYKCILYDLDMYICKVYNICTYMYNVQIAC